MCGIVGYVGLRVAADIILEGLQRLEYRGYDSAGIATVDSAEIHMARSVGKLINLRHLLQERPLTGSIGIGHTRWATHGAPATHNAHPHISMEGDFVVVHNGIVENYVKLREELISEGVSFRSETDTEVIAHLIERFAANGGSGDLTEALRQTAALLQGAQAIVALSRRQPDRLVAVRIGNAGGVAIGFGEGESFIASDIPAIVEHTRRVIFLENRDIATVTAADVQIQSLAGQARTLHPVTIPYDPVSAEKGPYRHFMQKEIFEQPRSLTDTIRGRVNFTTGHVSIDELNLTPEDARQISRMVIVACGTSFYSAQVGKFYMEQIARLNTEVDYGSEFRYRDPILDASTAVLAITQSGETVDTLAAMEEARGKGARLLSIVNAIGTQAMRMSDGCITMNAGPEIGVASTKAFTASMVAQYLLALALAQARGLLNQEQQIALVNDLARVPDQVGQVLEIDSQIQRIADALHHYSSFLFLGRGLNYPIALEGALKLKEISYIHAEGYPAGEMKHGPIALVDENMPVVAIALQDSVYDKMISQIEQAKARGAIVVAVATAGDTFIQTKADYVMFVPPVPPLISPLVSVVPLQLLAYHTALRRGADVDQPRNLAKSVTVE